MSTADAKKRYAQKSTETNQAKLKDGTYRAFRVQGLAADMDIIDSAIVEAGGSRTQALKKICAEWLAAR